jgi:cytoskeleton protein RodZ
VSDFGERLRQAREDKGLTLRQVEEATHIRRVFLQALEEERIADLPGDVYARGFVTTYASHLGLDAQELVRLYREAAGVRAVTAPTILNEPLMRRPRLGRLFWMVVIVALLGVLGWFAYDQLVAPLAGAGLWPPHLPLLRQATPLAPPPTATPTSTPSPTPAIEASAPTAVPSPTHTVPALTVATATPPPPTPTAVPTLSAEPGGEVAIVLEVVATAPTYLEVRLDGALDYVGTLQAGQTRIWTAAERVELRIGNAGGITLRVNDVEVPPLGQPGQVIDVVYTLDTLPTPP